MTVREIALAMLNEYETGGKYINLALSSHRRDSLSSGEKSALTVLLYTTVERLITLDYYLSKVAKRGKNQFDPYTLNILRLGACQILYMRNIPDYAAVNESVKLARSPEERSFVNGVLRALVRKEKEGELTLPPREKNEARYLSIEKSFPLSLVKHFISLYGVAETEKILDAYNSQNYTDLTVNLTRITREGLLSLFSENGTQASPSALSEITVRIDGSCDPEMLPGFNEGYFFVEDTASAISALVLGTREGDRVIDVCAAPGGKSFAAAILSGGGGVSSFDIHESKLSLISSGAERLGLDIEVAPLDATVGSEALYGSFDRVICDVPCSGLGVLGKKSDMRYRDIDGIFELPDLQYSILDVASRYLKTGGSMVYSTCTLNPPENERVVERFLAEHSDFRLVPFTVGEISSEGIFTLLPHVHNTDGFFISKLEKVK